MIRSALKHPYFALESMSRAYLTWLLIGALAVPWQTSKAATPGEDQAMAAAREYYSSNPNRRLLVKVQVWGDVPLSGVHHVPDTTTLIELVGYAGGPGGELAKIRLTLRHAADAGRAQVEDDAVKDLPGDELLTNAALARRTVKEGDVLYVRSDRSDETFMQHLSIVSTIVSIVASAVVVFVVLHDRQ